MSIGQDRRLYYFSNAMPGSSGKHSVASNDIKRMYGDVCSICNQKSKFKLEMKLMVVFNNNYY